MGFAKLPSEFEYLVFQNETLRNSQTHQALSDQKVRTNRTESRGFSMHRGRCLKTTHCLTFVFPAENETLDPILLGLRTSSSCISLSMLKVPNITQNLLRLIHKVAFQFLFPTNCLQNIYFFNNKINNTVALLGMIIRCRN